MHLLNLWSLVLLQDLLHIWFVSCMENCISLFFQVGICEIRADRWVRNGSQIRSQVRLYSDCHFCNSMLDLDIFMLQVSIVLLLRSTVFGGAYSRIGIVLRLLWFQNGCETFIATLLTGSDMSVINSGLNRKYYSDHSSHSYSGTYPKYWFALQVILTCR